MKLFPSVLLLAANLAATSPSEAADLEPEFPKPPTPIVNYQSGQVREFRVTLLDENDRPVIGVPVELYGMRRGGRWPSRNAGSRATSPWWSFITDAEGRILVRFPISEKPWDYTVPRDGRFYFVVDLPDGRRAVSLPIFHGVTRKDAHEEEENEWDAHAGDEQIFTDETGEVTMHLMKGRTVTGMVVTPDGEPLQGRTISVVHDLHIESRTGFGGEIFTVSATSDAGGKFKLENVYPAACSLSMQGEGYWSRTQISVRTDSHGTTRWLEGYPPLPEMSNDAEMNLRVVIAPKAPTHRYHGKVTLRDGTPLENFIVAAGVSGNPTPRTWSDFHHTEHATTDSEGRWSLEVNSPWVTFLSVSRTESGAPVYAEDYEGDGIGLARPGEYNLVVPSLETTK